MSAMVKSNSSTTSSSSSNYISYPLSRILQIADSVNETYTLPQEVIDTITELTNKVGAPSYNRTPVFHKNTEVKQRKKKNKAQQEIINDADWESIRNFQATQRDEKEGVDKLIDEIRRDLNKLSDKNYDKLVDNIKEKMVELNKIDTFSEENQNTIASLIFTIATTNKFYAAMYARLYKELTVEYKFIEKAFELKFESYISQFKEINYVNPDEDYNLFCKINKENEARRALSLFIVHMVKMDVLSCEYLTTLIKELIVITRSKMTQDKCKEQVDELSENMYTLVTESFKNIRHHDDYDTIIDFISYVKSQKSKDHKSLSSKTLFKYMDIHDYIKKNS